MNQAGDAVGDVDEPAVPSDDDTETSPNTASVADDEVDPTDDTPSPSIAKTGDDNAEILDVDDDIHTAYAQPAQDAAPAVADAEGASEVDVAPVVDPERP